jgi:precorrin-6B methylase 2
MPLIPNLLEQAMLMKFNIAPSAILDLGGAIAFRAAAAAIRLGVFDALSRGPLTAAEIAQQIAVNEHGLQVLLNVLEPLGYIKRLGDRYSNTSMTARWMTHDAEVSFAYMFEFWATILEKLMGTLEESIRTGTAQEDMYSWIEHEPETSRQFQTFMINSARMIRSEILSKAKLPKEAKCLLDIGGGHAEFSVMFCREYPQLSATIIDSPQALVTAQQNIAAEKMGDRITLRPGNFVIDDLGQGYDVVLLFNIVHGFRPEQNIDLLCKIAKAMNPGGQVIIAEQVVGKVSTPIANATNALFGLSFFHLINGNVYSFEEIAGWLTAAGFSSPERVNLFKVPGTSLITATGSS